LPALQFELPYDMPSRSHVFKLGTKYTEALNAKYLDLNEQQQTIIMGCYASA